MILAALALMQAAAPAPAAPAPEPRYYQQLRQLGMTDAGITILRRMSAPEPDAAAYNARRQALRQRLRDLVGKQPTDVEGFAGLLKAEAQAEGEARTRVAEKIAATMRALPAEDRPIFGRVILAQQSRPPAPAKPAPKPAGPVQP